MRALLAAHVEHVLRQTQKGLEGEGALANARFAAHEHDAARDEAAAQHAVELAVDHVDAGLVVSRDVTQAHPVAARGVGPEFAGRAPGRLLSCVGSHTDLLEGVPLSAAGTFSQPFRALLSTMGADVGYLVFCHFRSVYI